MQAPEDSTSIVSRSVYPPELSVPTPSPNHHWPDRHAIDPGTDRNHPISSWQLQLGGALAGTAAVSAGLAIPWASEQVITVPVGNTDLPTIPAVSETATTLAHQQSTQAVAFNQGQGVNPSVSDTQQTLIPLPAFSQSSPSDHGASFSSAPFSSSTSSPQLVMSDSGSWTLSYTDTAGSPANPLPTQAVVNQLINQSRTQRDCIGPACRSLAYIQKQLPGAQQEVTDLKQQLAEFETKHGQSDLIAYKSVLSDRISEITDQKTTVALQLSATKRYIRQIEVRLATIEVAPDLPKHLLAIDDEYQAHWLKLQQTERLLLEEFSQAKVDATALNQIYDQYEQQQVDLYQAAQAVQIGRAHV